MDTLGYLAVDQYGSTYQIGDNPPRKWLMNHLGNQHAQKMYVDTTDGMVRHTGYVIGGLWLTVHRVCTWKD
jgi:hypothetical protein